MLSGIHWTFISLSEDFLLSVGYITTVLDDAKVYSTHAGKKEIDTDDVQLAIQSRLDHSYTSPPPRDVRSFDIAWTWI